jgi:hypothetical protein
MKKLVLVAVLLLGFSMVAMAQDNPKIEVFGGYSFNKCDVGAGNLDVSCNLHGWDVSASFNGNKYLGLVADMSGYYGQATDQTTSIGPDVKIHSFLFGPKLAIRTGKVTPFMQGLFGLSHLNGNAGPGKANTSENQFAMAFGGGVDVHLNDLVNIRPAQLEYMTSKDASQFLNHFRYSVGIVFKLGKR